MTHIWDAGRTVSRAARTDASGRNPRRSKRCAARKEAREDQHRRALRLVTMPASVLASSTTTGCRRDPDAEERHGAPDAGNLGGCQKATSRSELAEPWRKWSRPALRKRRFILRVLIVHPTSTDAGRWISASFACKVRGWSCGGSTCLAVDVQERCSSVESDLIGRRQ
jgi:hypothetical protein